MLIDTHTHLNDARLVNDADTIIKEMKNDGLSAIINVGYDVKSSAYSVKLADENDGVYAAVGVHPHDSRLAVRGDYDLFSKYAENKRVVAIGETGLDFYYDYSDREVQKRVFLEHLELADALKLPVIIHLRDAYQEMYGLLKDNKHYLNNGAVMHCYSGSAEYLKLYSAFEQMFFAFGGAVTFKNSQKKDIVCAVPLDRLLLETDCPYQTPEPFRGKTNYPKYVNLVYQKIQSWLPNCDIAQLTTKNAKTLFKRLI